MSPHSPILVARKAEAMTPKTPTASGISRLLAKAGFERAQVQRFTLTSGFFAATSRAHPAAVRVGYRAAHINDHAQATRTDFLAAYAKTITEAGWTVEAGTYELVVTAKALERSDYDGKD